MLRAVQQRPPSLNVLPRFAREVIVNLMISPRGETRGTADSYFPYHLSHSTHAFVVNLSTSQCWKGQRQNNSQYNDPHPAVSQESLRLEFVCVFGHVNCSEIIFRCAPQKVDPAVRDLLFCGPQLLATDHIIVQLTIQLA